MKSLIFTFLLSIYVLSLNAFAQGDTNYNSVMLSADTYYLNLSLSKDEAIESNFSKSIKTIIANSEADRVNVMAKLKRPSNSFELSENSLLSVTFRLYNDNTDFRYDTYTPSHGVSVPYSAQYFYDVMDLLYTATIHKKNISIVGTFGARVIQNQKLNNILGSGQ